MSTQPDLIWQLAQRIGADFDRRGQGRGRGAGRGPRGPQRPAGRLLIDPAVDLRRVRDGLGSKPWILAAPTQRPRRLVAVH